MPALAAPADGKRILPLGYGVKAMHFCTIFATFWPWCRGRLGCGEGNLLHRGTFMARVLNEILLFSCIAAFVTGIVLAAASLLT